MKPLTVIVSLEPNVRSGYLPVEQGRESLAGTKGIEETLNRIKEVAAAGRGKRFCLNLTQRRASEYG